MTTKEKANNLYQKHLPQCVGYNGFFDKTNVDAEVSGKAKLSAIITCDEMINMTGLYCLSLSATIYWQKVKEDIMEL